MRPIFKDDVGDGVLKKKPDFTYLTVKRQLKAFGCEKYEVGVFDREKAQDPSAFAMQIEAMEPKAILKSLSWLKYKNIGGCDIFIRPLGASGFIFFDDLTLGKIGEMTEQGLAPSILLESSPMNYHGWIKVSDTPIAEDLATACCQVLVKQFGADSGSADWRHFGRLGGFTNQKKMYVDEEGKLPFVKLSKAQSELCRSAQLLLDQAKELMELRDQERLERAERLRENLGSHTSEAANRDFTDQWQRLEERYGAQLNHSKAEWMIAVSMAEKGFTQEQVYAAILNLSPDIAKRKAGREDRYIQETLNKIYIPEDRTGKQNI